MSTTFATYKTIPTQLLGEPTTDFEDIVGAWVNIARREFCVRRNWNFLKEQTTYTTVSTTNTFLITLFSSTAAKIININIAGEEDPVTYMNPKRFQQLFPPDQISAGTPEYYTQIGSTIYFDATVSTGTVLYIIYIKNITDVDATHDETDIPDRYVHCIFYNLLMHGAYWQEMANKATIARTLYESAVIQIIQDEGDNPDEDIVFWDGV